MEPTKPPRATGGCLCGAVRYEVRGPLKPVEVCHCAMCRRFHGDACAYTGVTRDALVFQKSGGLRWYDSSAIARRGFCGTCGSSLFFETHGGPGVGIAAGTLDGPTRLRTIGHIWVGSKGDYYEIQDGLPQAVEES